MPSIDDNFSVIHDYLRLRDEEASEDEEDLLYDVEQKVPQFMSGKDSFLGGVDPSTAFFDKLGAEGPLYLEQINQPQKYDKASYPAPTPLPPSSTPTTTTTTTLHPVNLHAGSGGTVSVLPSPPDQQLASSPEHPDLYDLDACHNQSFYPDMRHFLVKAEPVWTACEQTCSQDLRQRVVEDSCLLNLPLDPRQWTYEQTMVWVQYQFQIVGSKLGEDAAFLFNLAGTTLCLMEETDFVWRSPENGTHLYKMLQKWKEVGGMELDEVTFTQDSQLLSNYSNKDQWLAMMYSHIHHPTSPAPHSTNYSPYSSQSCSPAPHSYSPAPQSYSPAPQNYSPAPHSADPACYPSDSLDSTCSTESSKSSGASQYPSIVFDTAQDSLDAEFYDVTSFFDSAQSLPRGLSTPAPAPAPSAPLRSGRKQTIHLWQFLKELLEDPETYQTCIKWQDRARGIFKIEDSGKVARLWGRRKNRPAMNYDKLSRSVRQYYKKGIIRKTDHSKRLVYQFCQPFL